MQGVTVEFAVHSDRSHAEISASADHTNCDLATISYQNLGEHWHSLPDVAPHSEPSSAAFLRDAVSGTRFDQIGWVAETGSTNADLLELAAEAAPEQVLVTDLQTAGRGRRDRVWTAPSESGVLMSFLIREQRSVGPFWTIGTVALAAAAVISTLTVVPCQLKWPNDLLLDGAKMAGVLAQGTHGAVIVGIGINANWRGTRPDGVPEHATSIDEHLSAAAPGAPPAEVDRVAFVGDVVRCVDELLSLDAQRLRERWIAASATIGQRVRVEFDGGDAVIGTAVDVGQDGALVLEGPSGRTVHHVGDVVHARPD
jgi:BirA family biotin operon repressor/biotin-[acetyl-CoA-carboxylase] ligase